VTRAKRRRRSGGRSKSTGKDKLKLAAGAAAYGYADENGWLDKIPFIGEQRGGKRTAFFAVGAHYAAKQLRNKELDYVASGAAAVAGYQFGKAGFDLAKFESMSGISGDDYDAIEGGHMDEDEVIDLD